MYNLVLINIGSVPRSVALKNNAAPKGSAALPAVASASTPVKSIDSFCSRWDAICVRVLALPKGQWALIVVVGGSKE